MKKILFFILLFMATLSGFGQSIRISGLWIKSIHEPFGMTIPVKSQVFVDDSNCTYKITSLYTSTDSMTTVFRNHHFVKLCGSSITTVADTTGVDPTCTGLIIYALSDSTTWQHSFVIDTTAGHVGDTLGCAWIDVSTANWKTNGLDLYYAGGNVAVGMIPNAQAKFQVKGTNGIGIKVTTTLGNTYEGNSTGGIVFKGTSVNGVTVYGEATGTGNAGDFFANYGHGIYSTSVYGYAAWLAGKVRVTDTLWVDGKVYIRHILSAATSDSILGRNPAGQMVLFPRSSGSGVIADSVPFVYNAVRHSIYPRAFSTARVTIGSNETTADINRKLHIAGSQYIQDTLFFGTYGDAIWTEPGPFSFHVNNDFHIDYNGLFAYYLHISGLSNDATPDSILTIKDGDVYKSSTTIFKDSLYRYSAYSSGNNNVEVLATGLGITVSKSSGTIIFTIPAHVRIISAKVRVETLSSLICYVVGTDMTNTSLANSWMPICQAWREDTGQQLMGLTTLMSLTPYNKFTVNGLIVTTICQIRLNF